MNIVRKSVLALLAFGSFSLAARAQTPAAPAPLSADELSAIVSPYVDEHTLVVAHLDVARVDLEAAQKFATELYDAGGLPTGDENRKQLAESRLVADAFLSKFQSIGGRHVFAIISQQDVYPFLDPPVALLFPVENGADPKSLQQFLQPYAFSWNDGTATVEQLNDHLLVMAAPHVLAHLKAVQPQARPEFASGLSSSPEAALATVYAPTSDIRRVIAEMMPTFPPDSPIMPGASTDPLSKGVKYVSFALTLPPNLFATLTATTDSPQDAQQVAAFAKGVIQCLYNNPDYQKTISSTDPQDKPAIDAMQLLLKDLQSELDAQSGGSEVTLKLDSTQVHEFFQFAAPALAAARENAARATSMNQIHSLLSMGFSYADRNKGAWPATLSDLAITENAPLATTSPTSNRPYEYHPWTVDQMKKLPAATTPVLWETSDDPRAHIAVGFLDGHVELVTSKAALDEMLKKADQQLHSK